MRARLLLVFLTLAAGCGPGTSRSPEFPGAPVILVSIDTLRADHLPAYGYSKVETPNIDALQRDSILFENAYSQCPLTLPSHLSMLTGLLPAEHGVRTNLGYHFDGERAPDAGPDPPDARLRHGGRRVELRAARRDRHRRLLGLLRRFRGRRRGVDAGREPASAARRRDRSPCPRLGREREVEAVLPLPAHLRAAPPLRAARALPEPLRSDLRRRGRGERRRRRGACRRGSSATASTIARSSSWSPTTGKGSGTTESRSTGSCSTARSSTCRSC